VLRRRGRALPPDVALAYEAFLACAAHVDLAQRAMIRCVPSSPRATPLPLAVGAETLRVALADARAAMPGWQHPHVEDGWRACDRAIEETLEGLDRAVEVASATRELEVALMAVQDLLDPLHAFVEAEEAFGRLRT